MGMRGDSLKRLQAANQHALRRQPQTSATIWYLKFRVS